MCHIVGMLYKLFFLLLYAGKYRGEQVSTTTNLESKSIISGLSILVRPIIEHLNCLHQKICLMQTYRRLWGLLVSWVIVAQWSVHWHLEPSLLDSFLFHKEELWLMLQEKPSSLFCWLGALPSRHWHITHVINARKPSHPFLHPGGDQKLDGGTWWNIYHSLQPYTMKVWSYATEMALLLILERALHLLCVAYVATFPGLPHRDLKWPKYIHVCIYYCLFIHFHGIYRGTWSLPTEQ